MCEPLRVHGMQGREADHRITTLNPGNAVLMVELEGAECRITISPVLDFTLGLPHRSHYFTAVGRSSNTPLTPHPPALLLHPPPYRTCSFTAASHRPPRQQQEGEVAAGAHHRS